jgi:hypothetical protein
VRTPGDTSPLAAALDELSGLAGDDDRAALDALRGQLAGQRLRVLVAGEAKRVRARWSTRCSAGRCCRWA